jgi:hypothetical protein
MDDERSRRVKGPAISGAGRPELASRHQLQHSGLAYALYGISAGIGTTALGAWGASGITGGARIVVWVTVTAALSAGAAWIAVPVIALWTRPLRNQRSFRHPDPR